MELHHHPAAAKKKFREYFFEFLMIFLAVTLGFFAESYREYLSERSKEKEYVNSLVEDLKADTAFLETSIRELIPYHLMWMDSTERLFQLDDIRNKDRMIYQAFVIATAWTYDFHPTERTLSQLHSEGFHLIRSAESAKLISGLEDQYKLFSPANILFQNMQNDIDVSAYFFADRKITGLLFEKEFKNNQLFTVTMSDIPANATLKTSTREARLNYADRMARYGFYLEAAVKPDYINILNAIKKTLFGLEKEYNTSK